MCTATKCTRMHVTIQCAQAVEKMRLALRYRTELASTEPFRTMRAATAQATAIDLAVLPHADEVHRHGTCTACALHARCMCAACGLYMRCGPVRDSAPPNAQVLPHLPLRAVEGATADGLPVCLSVTRLFHFGALTDGTVDAAG